MSGSVETRLPSSMTTIKGNGRHSDSKQQDVELSSISSAVSDRSDISSDDDRRLEETGET